MNKPLKPSIKQPMKPQYASLALRAALTLAAVVAAPLAQA